jgi:hypothetical protein
MIKFNDIKIGDFLKAEYDGKMWDGEVVRLNNDEKQVCVEIKDVQDFWFSIDALQAIPLNEEEILKLNFTKEIENNGKVKYSKGAFRIETPIAGDFSHFEMWYREDKRHNPGIQFIHQLQNQYMDMTKVHLTKEAM